MVNDRIQLDVHDYAYLLRSCHKSPVNKRVCIRWTCAGEKHVVARHNADIAGVCFIEATSLNDRNAESLVSCQSCREGQASGATANNDIVERSIFAGSPKGVAFAIVTIGLIRSGKGDRSRRGAV